MDLLTLVIGIVLMILLSAMVYIVLLLRRPREEKLDQSALMLAQRLENLQQQMSQQLEQGRQATERSTGSVFSQVQNFTTGMEQLRSEMSRVQEQVHKVVSFQDIFRNPKLRGGWGEYSLESALAQYFPGGSWHMQHMFSSGEAVDAVLQLPNSMLLPVDSKFNWENFQKMVQAGDELTKEIHRKQFLADVKKRVDEIAEKYLLPGEGTTDFALMYVPAEAVYYEVINNLGEVDVADYARRKKVILCSPNTFYLTVTAVQHWFRDSQFSKQTQVIMKKLGTVITDAGKLGEEFRVLGKHISNTRSAYEDADKRLGLMVERTQKVIEMGEEQKKIS